MRQPAPRWTSALLATMAALGAACGPRIEPPDPAHLGEVQAWRAERLERLTTEDGWLTLVGLAWLEPGENTVGSDPSGDVLLEAPGVPAQAGVLTLAEDGTVTLTPAEDVAVTVNGELARAPQVLASDADGTPDIVELGRLRFYLIARGDRLGVRVKDPEAPTRTGFKGIEHFPVNGRFRVTATLERYPEPRDVTIATVAGTEDHMLAPGVLRFELAGEPSSLEPWISEPKETSLFVVFRDATSGDSTYGAGRFLSAELADDGTAVLDFNLAYNPPCAFTPYATCPLPPPENALTVPVTAGERYAGPAH